MNGAANTWVRADEQHDCMRCQSAHTRANATHTHTLRGRRVDVAARRTQLLVVQLQVQLHFSR